MLTLHLCCAQTDKTDYASTAFNTLQMDHETRALVRATEDVLTLTRQMQEMWLFGQLDTLGRSKLERETEEDARIVQALLGTVVRGQDAEQGDEEKIEK